MKHTTYYLGILITLVLLTRTQLAYAADYVISPLIIDHDIQARDTFEETVKITNTTDHQIRLFPTVNEISLGSEGAIEAFIPASMGDNTKSITSWIEVTRAQLQLAPGETLKIPITVRVNPNAVAGEYHGFVGFAEGSNRDEAEKKVAAGTAPGAIVRLSLVEKKSEYLRLERFAIDRFITGTRAAVANYDLENVGGLPITPTGEIIFYNSKGIEQDSIKLNLDGIVIPPGQKMTFTSTIPNLGTIGRYKAFLNIEYGSQQRANLYDTVYFNIVPIKLLVGVFAGLLTLSLILALFYHRSRRYHHTDEDEHVAVYVRSGQSGPEKDHDINLKQ